MPNSYGNFIAKQVRTGIARVGPDVWVRLVAQGSMPVPGRQVIEIQAKGGGALCIDYTNIDEHGNFTAPTNSGQGSKIIPAGTIKGEPLSDKVMLWGRHTAKVASTHGGMKVIVTEYT